MVTMGNYLGVSEFEHKWALLSSISNYYAEETYETPYSLPDIHLKVTSWFYFKDGFSII